MLSQKSATSTAPTYAPLRQQVNGSTPAGWIQIGTPKKWLNVIFDTGSDKLVAKTWDTIARELSSIDAGIGGLILPSGVIYNHDNSSTYHRMYMKDATTGKEIPGRSAITYGSGTAYTDNGEDTVSVGDRSVDNFTLLEITQDSLTMLHTSKGLAGVLGLQHMKNKSLGDSLFSQLRESGQMTSFGYCRGTANNGTFIWGDDSTEGHKVDVVGQMHWAVQLGAVRVHRTSSTEVTSAGTTAADATASSDATSTEPSKKTAAAAAVADKYGTVKNGEVAPDGNKVITDAGYGPSNASFISKSAVDHAIKKHVSAEIGEDEDKQSEAILALHNSCPKQGCTGILDTGSNILAGPKKAMTALIKLLAVKPDCSNFDTLPQIKMTLGTDLDVTVQPKSYVMKVAVQQPTGPQTAGAALLDDRRAPPSLVRREPRTMSAGLDQEAEEKAKFARFEANQQWKGLFERLHRENGVDLREQVDLILAEHDVTGQQYMCMPALVPVDKMTSYGPLFVVGTPVMDTYYTRFSWGKQDESPQIHLLPLENSTTCKATDTTPTEPGDSAPVLLRSPRRVLVAANHGPVERLLEDIKFPHWAKDLTHV